MARGTVNNRLDALDVGLPCSVRTSMGMGNLDAERHALAADIAFCHQLHLLAIGKSFLGARKAPTNIIAEVSSKCKHILKEKEKNSAILRPCAARTQFTGCQTRQKRV